MVQRLFFTRNRLRHFCNIDLKLNGFDIIQTKKAEKKQLLSSVHAVCIQLRELHRLFKEMLWLSLSIQNPFFLCGAASQPRIKRTSQSIGTKVSLIMSFSFSPPINTSSFSSFTFGKDTVSLFFVTMCIVERDTSSFWEDYIYPFTRKNGTKCVKIILRFSVYVPIHN